MSRSMDKRWGDSTKRYYTIDDFAQSRNCEKNMMGDRMCGIEEQWAVIRVRNEQGTPQLQVAYIIITVSSTGSCFIKLPTLLSGLQGDLWWPRCRSLSGVGMAQGFDGERASICLRSSARSSTTSLISCNCTQAVGTQMVTCILTYPPHTPMHTDRGATGGKINSLQ